MSARDGRGYILLVELIGLGQDRRSRGWDVDTVAWLVNHVLSALKKVVYTIYRSPHFAAKPSYDAHATPSSPPHSHPV
jgi:hypothetical protein